MVTGVRILWEKGNHGYVLAIVIKAGRFLGNRILRSILVILKYIFYTLRFLHAFFCILVRCCVRFDEIRCDTRPDSVLLLLLPPELFFLLGDSVNHTSGARQRAAKLQQNQGGLSFFQVCPTCSTTSREIFENPRAGVTSIIGVRDECRPKVENWTAWYSPMLIRNMQGYLTIRKEFIRRRQCGWSRLKKS